MVKAGIQVSKNLFHREGLIKMILDTPCYPAGQVQTRGPVNDRGPEKRATCGSAFPAVTLSVYSVWVSCRSRTGNTGGGLSEETPGGYLCARGFVFDPIGTVGYYVLYDLPTLKKFV